MSTPTTTITTTTDTDPVTLVNVFTVEPTQQLELVDALQRPDVREHMTAAAAIAKSWDPTLTRVRSIHHPTKPGA